MKKQNDIAPPCWADKLFKLLCPPEMFEELQGDMQEQFELDINRAGKAAARKTYIFEAVKFARPYYLKRRITSLLKPHPKPKRKLPHYSISKPLSPVMIKNYLTIARRNLSRHKSYTLINVLGLVLGMTCGILIFSLVNYHLGFDKFHAKADRIYRVTSELHNETVSKLGTVPQPIGAAIPY
jgi:putative ABC transport system permease protein